MVTHDKYSVLRYLIREVNVTFTERFIRNIRLIEQHIIHIHISVCINIDPVTGLCNHSFHQNLIIIVKCDDISAIQTAVLDRQHNITVLQGLIHGTTVNLQNRHPKSSHKNSYSCNRNQSINGASQNHTIAILVLFSGKLLLKIFKLRSFFQHFSFLCSIFSFLYCCQNLLLSAELHPGPGQCLFYPAHLCSTFLRSSFVFNGFGYIFALEIIFGTTRTASCLIR